MWTSKERQRYNLLREREYAGALTDAERVELMALMQSLQDDEAMEMAAANARQDRDLAEVTATVEQLETENQRLREYLRERQALLARVQSWVASIRAEERELRERYADVVPVGSEASSREAS